MRMAARYQHLSPAYLSNTVNLLDSAFAEKSEDAESSKEAEKRKEIAASAVAGRRWDKFLFYRDRSVTSGNALRASGDVSGFFCWRPRRDSNPRYRRERAVS
jgi:hypothetical protein